MTEGKGRGEDEGRRGWVEEQKRVTPRGEGREGRKGGPIRVRVRERG